MPLTEEQRAQIERKKAAAMAKRTAANGAPSGGGGPAAKRATPIPPSSSSLPQRTPSAPSATTFYRPFPSSSSSKPSSSSWSSQPAPSRGPAVQGRLCLTSPDRFLARVSYHDALIALFKATPSAQYQPQTRLWSFALQDHDDLVKRCAPLRPGVVLEPLPTWVVKVFVRKEGVGATSTKQRKKRPRSHEGETGSGRHVDVDEVDGEDEDALRARVEPALYEALMPFQKEGVAYAVKRKGRVFLADDMGLGKTVQALAIASVYRAEWPLLIVCPSSVRFAWKEACIRWVPSLPEEDITVITSGKDFLCSGQVLIISYDLLSRKESDLVQRSFGVAVADESHFLKNHKSNRTQSAAKVLKAARRLCLLTGTPALSRPIELYSQVSLLLPKLFPYATDFGMRYCDGKKMNFGQGRGSHYDFSGASNMDELKLVLEETCMLRRLKSAVLSQLPSKQRQMIILDPQTVKSKTREMDEQARRMGQKSLSTSERRGVLLEWFNATGKAKVKAVQDYLKDLLESGRKFVCFAHHQAMLNGVCDLLDSKPHSKNLRYVRIDGHTSSEARHRHCQQFQTDERTRVAVLSITAANAGLTLTATQLVVFAELFWNPGVLTQAEDRAHRIGQMECVVVQYLVAKGTADDELWPLLQRKLDVLKTAGLSKDNFHDSDALYAKVKADGDDEEQDDLDNSKITDFFHSANGGDKDADAKQNDADDADADDADADNGGGTSAALLSDLELAAWGDDDSFDEMMSGEAAAAAAADE